MGQIDRDRTHTGRVGLRLVTVWLLIAVTACDAAADRAEVTRSDEPILKITLTVDGKQVEGTAWVGLVSLSGPPGLAV
jgi:hypothetical protein